MIKGSKTKAIIHFLFQFGHLGARGIVVQPHVVPVNNLAPGVVFRVDKNRRPVLVIAMKRESVKTSNVQVWPKKFRFNVKNPYRSIFDSPNKQ